MWNLVPYSGMEPRPPCVGSTVLTTGRAGKSPSFLLWCGTLPQPLDDLCSWRSLSGSLSSPCVVPHPEAQPSTAAWSWLMPQTQFPSLSVIPVGSPRKQEGLAFVWSILKGFCMFYFELMCGSFCVASVLPWHQSLSRVRLFVTPWAAARQAPRPSPTPRVYSNSCPSSRWCHPTISSCIVPFPSCLQSFPASGSFPMSQLFTSGGKSIGVSASTVVPPMNTQDWSPLGWTGWISLKSKGLPRVFSNTTVHKHQFFGAQLSLQSNSHIHTWLLGKP